jgi:hypothetical protein
MLQPFYFTRPDARGEYEEYFVDDAGAYVMRERVRDLGHALTLRTDILSTNTFFRSFWSPDAKRELATLLGAADMVALGALMTTSQAGDG